MTITARPLACPCCDGTNLSRTVWLADSTVRWRCLSCGNRWQFKGERTEGPAFAAGTTVFIQRVVRAETEAVIKAVNRALLDQLRSAGAMR